MTERGKHGKATKARSWAWTMLLMPAAAIGWSCAVRPPHEPLGSPIEIAAAGPADNSFCYVCHLNFKKETLAQSHRPSGLGCASCHGYSDKHSSDEDGVTPPEVMYAQGKVNPSCVKCHNGYGTFAAAAEQAMWKASAKQYCTDCHGEHRLAVRTRRWDKVTGKLVYDDGVRMTQGGGVKME